jgi:S-adenosylmethionine decarboxylase
MRHILFTLKGCNVELMEDIDYMRLMLYNAAKECNSTLLNLSVHKFEPQGFTGIAMLAESHISIHTWPEKSMAVCDAFTCGDHTTPEKGVEYMKEMLQASNIISREFVRPLE